MPTQCFGDGATSVSLVTTTKDLCSWVILKKMQLQLNFTSILQKRSKKAAEGILFIDLA
jgi:hypothetical protein